MAGFRRRSAFLALAALAVAAAAVAYGIAGSAVFAADRPPGPIETAVARRLVRLSIPFGDRRAVNPFAGDDAAWRSGADHFAGHCASCHGADGRGRSEIGAKMYPPVPDLGSDAIQHFSDGALFAIIKNGVRWTGMPAFRTTDSDAEIWKLVSFIRHVPAATAADATRHDADEGDGSDRAPAVRIVMDGTRFEPAETTVAAGAVVEWVNRDPFPHNVTSEAGGLQSGDLEPERSWRRRASRRGTFEYVCTLHPGMTGVLHVQ